MTPIGSRSTLMRSLASTAQRRLRARRALARSLEQSDAGTEACTPASLLADREERLIPAYVAPRARLPLGALLSLLEAGARVSEPGLERGAVELVRRDRLLDEHQRAVLGELQVSLGLGEAHDLRLRAVQPQLGRFEQREHRLVVGEDPDRAQGGVGGEHLHLLVEHLALGGEDLDWEFRARHDDQPRGAASPALPRRGWRAATPDHWAFGLISW